MTRLTDSIVFDDHDVQERFVRATGSGGINVDKDATAVELRLDLRKSSLPADLKARLTALAGRHVTHDGVLVVVSRAFRSQAKNRDAARARLMALVTLAAHHEKSECQRPHLGWRRRSGCAKSISSGP
jgi:ribosome-associated protein